MYREPHAHSFTDQPHPPGARTHYQQPTSSMRVSDADRADVANALCRHFADGRLNEEELNERLARVNAAKTRVELGPPLADLPGLDGEVGPTRKGGWQVSRVLLGVVVVLFALWGTAGALSDFIHPHVPWVIIAIVAIVVLRRTRHRP